MPSPPTLTVISLGGDVQPPTVSDIDSRLHSLIRFRHHPYLFGDRVETVLPGGLCLCMGVAIDHQPLQVVQVLH